MAEEASLSLVWRLLLSGGPTLLCREELGTRLDFAGFFLPFLRVLPRGNCPIQEGFSLEVWPPSPGWEVTSLSSALAACGVSREARGAGEHSHPWHCTCSAHQKLQEGARHDGIVSERRGSSRALHLPLKCCPWRFSSCSRLLAHQLFNSLQPCGLQPRVLLSSERTSLCVRRAGGCGDRAGQRVPAGKPCRGTGNRSHQPKC